MQYSVLEPLNFSELSDGQGRNAIEFPYAVEMELTVSILSHTDSTYNGGHKISNVYKVLLPV